MPPTTAIERTPEQSRVEWELQRLSRPNAARPETAEGPRLLEYPARLGQLAVESLLIDPVSDAETVTLGVKTDLQNSYTRVDRQAGAALRHRSMAWLDWLTQNDALRVGPDTYLKLAIIAAENGDAEMIHSVVRNPRQLWPDHYAATSAEDPAFGKLDTIAVSDLSTKALQLTQLLKVTKMKKVDEAQASIAPVVGGILQELATRDMMPYPKIVYDIAHNLLMHKDAELNGQAQAFIDSLPMTVRRLSILESLKSYKVLAPTVVAAVEWYTKKTELAEKVLGQFMYVNGGERGLVYLSPIPADTQENEARGQQIAAAIAEHIPEGGDGTSDIETSVAYMNGVHHYGVTFDHILTCTRVQTGEEHFEFANPRFGFSADFSTGEYKDFQSIVTVVDANLPDGRLVINLSEEQFAHSDYNEMRLLCRRLQIERNRKKSTTRPKTVERPVFDWLHGPERREDHSTAA